MKNAATFHSLIVVFLLLICVQSAQSQNSLSIYTQNSSTQNISLSSIDKIIFSISGMEIKTSDGSEKDFDLKNISKMIFLSTSAVTNVSTDQPAIYPNPAKSFIYLKNIDTTSSTAYIYNSNGQLLQTVTIDSGSGIDISQLTEGLYFLKTNNKVFKFSKL